MSKERHQITNFLLTVGLQISHIKKAFPEIMEGYSKAKEHNLLSTPLSDRQLTLLQGTIEGIDLEFEKLRCAIENLPLK